MAKQNDSFHNSEWGPEAAEAMCKEIATSDALEAKDRNLTLGDSIDKSSKRLISKVMREEKSFSIWHGGRTILLGDSSVLLGDRTCNYLNSGFDLAIYAPL